MVQFYEHISKATRIAIAGDWHLNIYAIDKILNNIARKNADVVLQVGDFGYFPNDELYSSYVKRITAHAQVHDYIVIFIDGNHEQYAPIPSAKYLDTTILTRDGLDVLKGRANEDGIVAITPRIFWATRGATIRIGTDGGKRGVSVLACGGAGSIDREYQQMRGDWSKSEFVTAADVEAVKQGVQRLGGSVDIMITHDAPMGAWYPAEIANKKASKVPASIVADCDKSRERLAEAVVAAEPTLLVHGHWHAYNRSVQVPVGDIIIPETFSLVQETGANNLIFTDSTRWDCEPRELLKKLYGNALWI